MAEKKTKNTKKKSAEKGVKTVTKKSRKSEKQDLDAKNKVERSKFLKVEYGPTILTLPETVTLEETPTTFEGWLEGVKQDVTLLGKAPLAYYDDAKIECLALEAVKAFGEALIYVPEKNKTPEICTEAVQTNSDMIDIVPKMYKSENGALLSFDAMKKAWNKFKKGNRK